jgi:hypothetical protein
MWFQDFNVFSALATCLITLAVSYISGQALWSFFKPGPRTMSLPFFVVFPIICSLGLIGLSLVFFVSGILRLTLFTVFVVVAISLLLVAMRRKKLNVKMEKLRSSESLVPLLLFVISICYFASVAGYWIMPPVGDIVVGHGPFVSVIEAEGRVSMESVWLSSPYPLGFHATVATFNQIFRFYPGQAILVLGAVISALLPLIIYAIVFILTRSILLSLVGYLSAFYVHSSSNMEKFLLGPFFNGPYPNLMGYLILFTYIALLCSIPDLPSKPNRKWFWFIGLLIFGALLITYPSFSLLLIVINTIPWIQRIHRQPPQKLLQKTLVFFGIIFSLVALCLAFLYANSFLQSAMQDAQSLLSQLQESKIYYSISPFSFFDDLSGIIAILAIPFALYLYRRHRQRIALIYIIILVLVVLSLIPILFDYFLFFILPSRSLVILFALAWPIILIGFDSFIDEPMPQGPSNMLNRVYVQMKLFFSKKRKLLSATPRYDHIFAAVIGIIILGPCFYGHLSFTYANTLAWNVTKSPSFQDDFAALKWLNANAEPSALILNDGSWTSMYILSMSMKNITFFPYNVWVNPERAKELWQIWQKPTNITHVAELLKKYNVSYIFSTSENGYFDSLRKVYKNKLFSPSIYAWIFDRYTFLEPVFSSKNTRIYKVLDGLLQDFTS